MKNPVYYGVYKGDEFITVGTGKECAEALGVSERSLKFYASPTYKKRTTGNALVVIRLEEVEE